MALLFTPQGVILSGNLLNVLADEGRAVIFRTPFSQIKMTAGDYHLDYHAYTSIVEATKTEIAFTNVIKTPTGLSFFPQLDAAYITWQATPLTNELSTSTIPTTQTGVSSGAVPQSGRDVFTGEGNQTITFTTEYDSEDNYNLAYLRAYLTAEPTIPVQITIVTKLTTGLLFVNPYDGQITVEWGVENRTQ